MRKIIFYFFLLIGTVSTFSSCSKDDDKKENNPFIGTWKDPAYENNGWAKYTFRKDMTYQYMIYDGEYGSTEIEDGKYDYSTGTKTITLVYDDKNSETETLKYNFPDEKTLILGEYAYFKE